MGAYNRADVALTTQFRLSGAQPPYSDSHHYVDAPASFWFPEESHQGIVSSREMERALSEGRGVFNSVEFVRLQRRHVEERNARRTSDFVICIWSSSSRKYFTVLLDLILPVEANSNAVEMVSA